MTRRCRHGLRASPRSTAVLAAVLATCLSACGAGPATSSPAPPDPQLQSLRARAGMLACPSGLGGGFPARRLDCLSGGPAVLLNAPTDRRPMLVNIWATWCGPCVREAPTLVDLAATAGDQLRVVGVLTQDTPRNGLEFARQFAMTYPSVLDDDGTVLRAFSPGPPASVLVDAAGQVVFVKRGEIKNREEMRALLATHLGLPPGNNAPPGTPPTAPVVPVVPAAPAGSSAFPGRS